MKKPTKMFAPENTTTYPRALAGLVALELGDVVQRDRGPAIVIKVNPSEAVIERLSGSKVAAVEGRKQEYRTHDMVERLSTSVAKHLIIERRGEKGLQDFLDAKSARQGKPTTQQTTTDIESEETDMAKRAKSKKTAAAKKETTNGAREGSLGLIHGFSVASVVRRLGKEGVKGSHMMAILEAQKIKASKPGVQTMLFNGRKGIGGDPAELTATQVKDLIASAEVPARANAAEPKVEAEAK